VNVLMITQTVDRFDDVLGATHSLVERLADRIERLYVLQLWAGRDALPPNVVVTSMGKERGASKPAQLSALLSSVRRLTRSRQVDLVFAHMAPVFAICSAPIARLSGVPTVLWYAHRQVTLELRLATSLVDWIVSPTRDGFRILTPKLRTVGHGVDVDLFQPQPPPADSVLEVLSLGRITPIKRLETLLEAVAFARSAGAPIRLTTQGPAEGDGDRAYLERLRRQTESLKLDGLVRFAAPIPYVETPAAYARCHVHVNLAPTGAPDKAVLETMAAGRIPLACNRTFESVFAADSGSLMFQEQDARDLSRRLCHWASADGEERGRVAQRLREIVVRDHSTDGLADRLLEVFRDALAARGLSA
jgi:glycosyltransferase involved in cell wall biosynthesis